MKKLIILLSLLVILTSCKDTITINGGDANNKITNKFELVCDEWADHTNFRIFKDKETNFEYIVIGSGNSPSVTPRLK